MSGSRALDWIAVALTVAGFAWLLDRMVFGINAPGLFA
jgi:hypothetical protein